MWIPAQAVAEYGGLVSSRAASASLDDLVTRALSGSTTDYILVLVGVIVAMYIISRLLDAA